ncbi:MAG: nickel-dependent lactate racemase [Endomicrobiia bacterium]
MKQKILNQKNYTLKYGNTEISFFLNPKNVISVLELKNKSYPKIKNLKDEFINSLDNPLGSISLKKLVSKIKPKKIVVVVEDITRANPYYPELLKILFKYLPEQYRKRLMFLIALGTHRPHSKNDNIKVYGEEIVKKCKFINHNCDSDKLNKYIGTTSFGNKIFINKNAVDADLVIFTGSIDTHSFAGYSGTRKSILPGIAARKSITFNHSFVVDENSTMGNVENNKINLDMIESTNLFLKNRNTFFINFIKNYKKELVKILSGEFSAVYSKGIEIAKKLFSVPIKKLSDVTIVSCGGYPRDINLYQAQKGLTCATLTTKIGGTIILVAECSEGIGQKIFADWLTKKSLNEILHTKQHKIIVEGHRAYLTAKILQNYHCILVSKIAKDTVRKLKFHYARDINEAICKINKKYKNKYRCYIIPNGSSILPIKK